MLITSMLELNGKRCFIQNYDRLIKTSKIQFSLIS